MALRRRELLYTGAGITAAMLAGGPRGAAAGQAGGAGKVARFGAIGLGNRGRYLLGLLARVEGAQITALCDLSPENVERAAQIAVAAGGGEPARFSGSPEAYRDLLSRDDVDAVLIATPTKWHCPMAVEAMKAGKHVGSEVPAGFFAEELWELVRTKEATGRRYMLLENYLYTRQSLMIWQMARAGVFGDPYYAEAAYLHDCRFMLFRPDGTLDWWGEWASKHYGSDYPTHAMGPVCKWLGIHEGDRLSHCTCMMSRPRVLGQYAAAKFGADSPQGRIEWAMGDYVSMTIMTEKGRLIRMDYDVNSPRPADFPYVLQGTKGIFDSRRGVYIEEQSPHEKWEPAAKYQEAYDHPCWRTEGDRAEKAGHGGGDYFVIRDLVGMVLADREPWIDVYDAAGWSVLFDCSRRSIDARGAAVEIPDFTGGRWRDPDWRRDHHRPA